MNVLYITDTEVDYESMMLLHGLYQIENVCVYLYNDLPWLFSDYSKDTTKLYGKGFNTTKLVDFRKKHIQEKNEIIVNIKRKSYDLVVYGVAHKYTPFLNLVIDNYDKMKIIFVDGADENFGLKKNHVSFGGLLPDSHLFPVQYIPFMAIKKALYLRKKGIYFKREISKLYKRKFIPIEFAIPEQLIVDEIEHMEKRRLTALIYPGHKETYIYSNAEDYNDGYKEAMFGVTFKKAGWDCYRHYEILANGCIPYFPDIDSCPTDTMFLLPKQIIHITNNLYKKWEVDGFTKVNQNVYKYYQEMLLDYTKHNLTTKALAKYVLSYADVCAK